MSERDDLRVLAAEATRATVAGLVAPDGTRWGSDRGHRTMIRTRPTSRVRCTCCGHRATHIGLGDGLALMSGCELRVRRWVREGRDA